MRENSSTDDTDEGEKDQQSAGAHVLVSGIHDLQDRLDAVERALEADEFGGSSGDATVEDLRTEIESLQSRIDRQEQAVDSLRDDVDEIRASVHLVLDVLARDHDTVSDPAVTDDA